MRILFKYFVTCYLLLILLTSAYIPVDDPTEWIRYCENFSQSSPYSQEEELAIRSIPEQYRNWFIYWSKHYQISIPIAVSIATHESGFHAKAIGYNRDITGEVWSEDRGIFQINSYYEKQFAKDFFVGEKKFDALNPFDNIQVGLAIIQDLYIYFKDYNRVIRAFNIGQYTEFLKRNSGKGDLYLSRVMKTYVTIMTKKDLPLDKISIQ